MLFRSAYGTALTLRDKPEVEEGYEFLGWFGFPEDSKMPAADLTITGTIKAKEFISTVSMSSIHW